MIPIITRCFCGTLPIFTSLLTSLDINFKLIQNNFSPENVIFPKNFHLFLDSKPSFSQTKKSGVGRAQSIISMFDGHNQINNKISQVKTGKKKSQTLSLVSYSSKISKKQGYIILFSYGVFFVLLITVPPSNWQ